MLLYVTKATHIHALFTVAGAAQQAATRALTFQAAVLSKVRCFYPATCGRAVFALVLPGALAGK